MAHIIQARNKNKEEVEAFISQQAQMYRKKMESLEAFRPLFRIISILIILACIVTAAVLLIKDGLLTDISFKVMNVLADWSDGLFAIGKGGKSIFHLALRLAFGILGLVLLAILAAGPLIIPIVILAALAAIVYVSVKVFIFSTFCYYTEDDFRNMAEKDMSDELHILNAGVIGEEAALNTVSVLGDECYIFANLDIEYDGEHNETDLIIVSPTGLSVVEVKNYSGILTGDLSDREIIRIKKFKNGDCDEKKESNPVRQIGAPIYKLAHYLKDQGIPVNVRGCALFVHENVEFQLTDHKGLANKCPLFLMHEPADFLHYLHNDEVQTLRPDQIRQIVKALIKQI